MKKYFAMSIIAASVALAACSDDDDDDMDAEPTVPPVVVPDLPDVTPGEGNTVFDTIAGSADHTTLLAAIETLDLATTLDNPASMFTVFAPTNAAFDALLALDPDDAFTETADFLAPENATAVTRILQGHVAPELIPSGTVVERAVDGATATPTLATDAPLSFAATTTDPAATSGFDVVGAAEGAGPIALNDIDLGADAMQGVVHSIDSVIAVPPAAEAPPVEGETPPVEGETPPVAGGAGDAVLAGTGTNEIFRAAIAANFAANIDADMWTIFAPTDAVLGAASVTELTADQVRTHIHTLAALDPTSLAGVGTIGAADNTVLNIATDADGNVTVNGIVATFIGTGAGGAQIYSIDGVLAAAPAP